MILFAGLLCISNFLYFFSDFYILFFNFRSEFLLSFNKPILVDFIFDFKKKVTLYFIQKYFSSFYIYIFLNHSNSHLKFLILRGFCS